MFMKCENFVNTWEANKDNSKSQVIAFRFYPQVLEHIYQNHLPKIFTEDSASIGASLVRIKPEESLKNFVKNLTFYLDNPELLTQEMLALKLRELIVLISKLEEHSVIKQTLKSLFHSKSIHFNTIIQAHLYENLKMSELAFICGVSLSSFKRQFHSVFGTTPRRYIREQRILKAQELLHNSQLSISEIAYSIGFESAAHFSKTFRTLCKCSPTEYQKMQNQ